MVNADGADGACSHLAEGTFPRISRGSNHQEPRARGVERPFAACCHFGGLCFRLGTHQSRSWLGESSGEGYYVGVAGFGPQSAAQAQGQAQKKRMVASQRSSGDEDQATNLAGQRALPSMYRLQPWRQRTKLRRLEAPQQSAAPLGCQNAAHGRIQDE